MPLISMKQYRAIKMNKHYVEIRDRRYTPAAGSNAAALARSAAQVTASEPLGGRLIVVFALGPWRDKELFPRATCLSSTCAPLAAPHPRQGPSEQPPQPSLTSHGVTTLRYWVTRHVNIYATASHVRSARRSKGADRDVSQLVSPKIQGKKRKVSKNLRVKNK